MLYLWSVLSLVLLLFAYWRQSTRMLNSSLPAGDRVLLGYLLDAVPRGLLTEVLPRGPGRRFSTHCKQ